MSKSSERITEKRTVITSSSNAYDDADNSVYFKSGINPRQSTVVSRSSVGPSLRASVGGGGSGGTVYTRTVEYGIGRSSGLGNLSPGSFEKASNTGVHSVKVNREREKKDMQDLNERFANYIEKVRFLEAQNRKLASELEHLKTKWGKETSAIKSMYEQELAEARKLIDDLTRDKSKLEIQNSSIQEEMNNLRKQMEDLKKYHSIDQEQINKLNQQVSDYEAEINMLRRTISSLETERGRDKDRINKLQGEVDRLRIDLNNETLNHLDAENRRQTLEEEMEFLKKVHEQELKELAALAYRDTTEENREFWKSELSQAIRDIQSEYDNKIDQIRGDMESYYNLKVQEFRTGATKQNMEVTHVKEENKKLVKSISDLKGRLADLEARNAQLESQYNSLLREYESIQSEHTMETVKLKEEITNLRAEMEAILVELQTLMDAKLSLELEIAAYRKLLESEESRVERLRRLGINVRNFRGSFLSSPVEYKLEPVSDYSGNTNIDDEQTERDITPDDDDTQLDMDKQLEKANEDEVESKSDEPTVDKTTVGNQETSKCITPEEVKESEIIVAQESNVSKAPPPQQQPEGSQCQDVGGCSKVEGEVELHDEIVTGSATTSDVHHSVGNKSQTDVNQTEEITSNTQIENNDVEEESFSTDNKTISKDQTDDKDIARAEPDNKDIARAEPEDKRIESEADINSKNNQISADKDVENQNIENSVKDSVNESSATDTANKEDEVTLTGAEDKPSEDNKTEALSDENKGDISVADSKQIKSSDDKEQEKPADDSEQMKSSDDKEQAKSSDDKEKTKSSDDSEQMKSSDDKEQAKSSDDSEQMKSSDDKEQAKSSDDKEQAKPAEDSEEMKSADDGEQLKSVDESKQMKSSDDSETIKSVDNSDQTKSVDNSEQMKSSDDNEQMKSADESKQDDERQQTEIENKQENKTVVDIATHDEIEPKSDNNEGSKGTENLPQTLDNQSQNQNQDSEEHCNQNNGTDDILDKQNKPVIADDTLKQPDKNIASTDTTNKSESKGKGDESIEASVTKEDENKITMNGDGHMEAGNIDEKLNNDAVEMMNENEGEQDSHSSMKMMRGEVSAKTTYQKSSTGPVSIADVNPEGKYITLENTSSQRREVNLDGWKIQRELDDHGDIIYTFRNFTLKPHKSVKIFTRGASAEAGINDLVFREEDSWGVGSRATTTLFNEKGDEKAIHKQRTNYN